MIADASCPFNLPGAVAKARNAVGQRADRAEINNVATRFGINWLAFLDVNNRLTTALKERQLRFIFPLFQVADTTPADHTALLVQHNRVGDAVVLLFAPLGFNQLADARAIAQGLIL